MKISPEQNKIYGLTEELNNIPALDDIPKVQKDDLGKVSIAISIYFTLLT